MNGRSRILTIVFLFVAVNLFAQKPLWDWSKDAERHKSVVRIVTSEGGGSGVLIHVDKSRPKSGGYIGYCLTAYHMIVEWEVSNSGNASMGNVLPKEKIRVKYQNGQDGKDCDVEVYSEEHDVVILRVWVPAGVEPVKVAENAAKYGDKIELAGYGGEGELRHFHAKASATTNGNKIFSDAVIIPGDSGGAVFNKDGEVVGVISGGWFWWNATDEGKAMKATWPTRICNVDVVRELMSQVEMSAK